MKTELPCSVVRDLLPGFADKLTGEETSSAVTEHLAACEACRKIYEHMSAETPASAPLDSSEDVKLLKKMKKRLNKRARLTLCICSIAIILVAAALYVLFNVPLKTIDISDVSVSAKVYPVSDMDKQKLPANYEDTSGNTSVVISSGDDVGDSYSIVFPDNDNIGIVMTDGAIANCPYITSITWNSRYFLRDIRYSSEKEEDGVLYISAFKTTILNNRDKGYTPQAMNLEMKEINKIVYSPKNGEEIVMWER